MNSLPKIIKPAKLVASEEVVRIPDAPTVQPVAAEEPVPEIITEEVGAKGRSILEEDAAERANDVGRKILQAARAERERMLEQAREEAGQIREQARQEAYQQALGEKRDEIAACLGQTQRLLDELQQEQEEFLLQYEKGLSGLALEIAEKVIGTSIREDTGLMAALVREAVSSVKNADWIGVQVSDRLPGLVEKLQQELSARQDLLHPVEVTASSLPEGSCIIHTPDGIVDASVSVQLDNLRSLFRQSG